MTNAIGVVMTEHIVTGRLQDLRLTGKPLRYPADTDEVDALTAIPSGELIDLLATQIAAVATEEGGPLDAIGVAVPGIVRRGVVEDSPNLHQIKGMRLGEELSRALSGHDITAPVHIANDADAIAAGVAATRGQLNKLTRVWTLGNGIGYGRWPYVDGIWEGGHVVVSLDPKEKFCGCGGVGHLEGIMGYRAMRLRFLDLEPEEVFAHAKQGDQRCREFVDSGIAPWPRQPPHSSILPVQDASTSLATTLIFSNWISCAAILNNGQNEHPAGLFVRSPSPRRRNRPARGRRLRSPRPRQLTNGC